jgi:hypothetical protein
MFLFFECFIGNAVYRHKMKINSGFRKWLLALIFVSGQLYVYAQPGDRSLLSIGTKHGINISQIIFEPPVKQNVTLGYTGGLVVKYISEKHMGLQAEINYSQRGWTENLDSSRSYSRSLDYFELPILTHVVLGSKKTRVFLNLGPNLSYHTSDKESFSLLRTGDTLSYYQRKLDRDFEFGLVGGAGIYQTTGFGDFQLEFRFHYGFQNIFFSENITNLSKSQNQLYSITLAYFFFRKDFKAKKK